MFGQTIHSAFPCLMKLIRLEYLAVKKQERGKDGLNIRFKN
ncbi:hypothetical protein BACDOR_01501 [Phocaeicola dorei DSM 17855]|uniref:Uncharacterized protein n=1 Tax=Phocaeicola dorei DSM 17855 TaxID=483217 RepID=B6VW08_9BACT|nr:hypothetical protein BACDOR_01501 [Phocaeicola dorei DSM 17855]